MKIVVLVSLFQFWRAPLGEILLMLSCPCRTQILTRGFIERCSGFACGSVIEMLSCASATAHTNTKDSEFANQPIMAESCCSRPECCEVQPGVEHVCPAEREADGSSNIGPRFPPPETFHRATRRSKVDSHLTTVCQVESAVPLSMDEFILETVMDAREFADNTPVNYCLLRILSAPPKKK